MKILTVRQPWAWAIIHGGKDVENRSTNIAGSYRGPIAIHAGLAYDEDAVIWAGGQPFAVDEDGSHREPAGSIIGVVDLVDVHFSGMECGRVPEGTCHEYNLCSEWARAYEYHLVLKNPHALAAPIPYKGALGLRDLPADVEQLVLEELQS